MKKLIAIVLAALMLLSCAAIAEPVTRVTISSPSVTMTGADENQSVYLEDFAANLICGMAAGIPTIEMDAGNAEGTLVSGVMQLIDGRVFLDIDGVTNTYYAAVKPEQLAGMAQQGYEEVIFPSMADAVNAEMPMLPAVSLPKFGMMSLVGMLGVQPETAADGSQSANFTVDYQTINAMVNQLLPYVDQLGLGDQVGQVVEVVKQFTESNSGVNIEGTATDDGTIEELVLNFYLVQDGTATESPMFGLDLTSKQDMMNLAVLVDMGGGMQTVGTITGTTNAEAKTMSFVLDVMGMVTADLEIYPDENGMQVITLEVGANGETFSMALTYGKDQDADSVTFGVSVPTGEAFEIAVVTVSQEDGRHGVVTVDFANPDGSQGEISANLDIVNEEAELRSVRDTAGALDLENLTDEQAAQMNEEIGAAAAALVSYLNAFDAAA